MRPLANKRLQEGWISSIVSLALGDLKDPLRKGDADFTAQD